MREQDMPGMMDRLNLGGRPNQSSFAFGQQHDPDAVHAQQVSAMLGDRAQLQQEQENALRFGDVADQQAAQSFSDRLQQFNELRVQTDMEQSSTSKAAPPPEGVIGKPSTSAQQQHESDPASPEPSQDQGQSDERQNEPADQEPLSLTEQVQKAASAKHSPQPPSTAWNKVEPAIFPFPPPPSQSPLPAPAAQRKPIVAENLTTESRSGAATPAADTPSVSIAPWAKEPANTSHGPSLKEIQEMEAKKAAEREAIAAAARREAWEKELAAQAQSPAVQPGLPSSSTWASGASPVTPNAASASVWTKPVAKVAATPTPSSKKTLQQIQKEEEARKHRAAAQAVAAANAAGGAAAPVASPAGKRYADLASKSGPALPAMPIGNSAWTTVGASGKVKTPGGTTPVPPAVRSTSSTIVPSLAKKPTVTRTTTSTAVQPGKANAEEEFRKWALNELRHDLQKSINGMFSVYIVCNNDVLML
jgi:PERQ amino acid-rich with GYF domain-containing protein